MDIAHKILIYTLNAIALIAYVTLLFELYKKIKTPVIIKIKSISCSIIFKSDYKPVYCGYNLFTIIIMYADATLSLILLPFGYRSKLLVKHLITTTLNDKRPVKDKVKVSTVSATV